MSIKGVGEASETQGRDTHATSQQAGKAPLEPPETPAVTWDVAAV